MPRTGQPAVRRVAAVDRALAVIDALSDGSPDLGTNEIARRTHINASTVSRLLATLAAAGIVEHVPATGRYRLGLRLLQLGNAVLARLDLREVARPHLEALVAETGETATLSIAGERDAVTVDFVQSGASVQSVAHVGRPSVAHATAVGKVMLALGAVEQQDVELERFTPRTITDARKLATELDRVRRLGYAEAAGEREAHLNAIAAPVFGASGELAAILGLQGPAQRFGREVMKAAVEILLDHAKAISTTLGAASTYGNQTRQPARSRTARAARR